MYDPFVMRVFECPQPSRTSVGVSISQSGQVGRVKGSNTHVPSIGVKCRRVRESNDPLRVTDQATEIDGRYDPGGPPTPSSDHNCRNVRIVYGRLKLLAPSNIVTRQKTVAGKNVLIVRNAIPGRQPSNCSSKKRPVKRSGRCDDADFRSWFEVWGDNHLRLDATAQYNGQLAKMACAASNSCVDRRSASI